MPEFLLTVREDEDGLFIRLPVEVAEQLDVSPGDRVNLAPANGGFVLSSGRPDLDRDDGLMLRAFEQIREQYDSTLRRLADS